MHDDLPYKVFRMGARNEVLACAINLTIGRAAYETAVRMFPRDLIEYRYRARVLARSTEHKPDGKSNDASS
jgi:hypothetical protein